MPEHKKDVDYRIETRLSRVEHWRIGFEIAALVVAAFWGMYVFVYQERIKPAYAPAELQADVSISHSLTPSGQEFVSIDDDFKNIGAADVRLVGISVSVYGLRFEKSAHARSDMHPEYQGWRDEIRTSDTSPPVLLRSAVDLFSPSGHSNRSVTIPGGGDLRQSPPITFGVPHGEFDVLTVRMQMIYVKGTDYRTFDFPWRKNPDGSLDILSIGARAPSGVDMHQRIRQFAL